LIDISRGEMGILKIKQEPVKIDAMIKDVARSIQPQITQKHLNLIIDLAPQIPVTLGDELRLRQILQNLLDNAMKFTPAGGEISVQAIADTETIMVKVKDHRMRHRYRRPGKIIPAQ
jgi:signal transduction histidine kinase